MTEMDRFGSLETAEAMRQMPTGIRNPFTLPPGPERRELMDQQFKNISPNDYTLEELAELERQTEAGRQVIASLDADSSS